MIRTAQTIKTGSMPRRLMSARMATPLAMQPHRARLLPQRVTPRRAALGVAVSALLWTAAGGAVAGPVEVLPGRWAGWGAITLDGGEKENVKCIATYFSEQDGRVLRQNLRCASSNYRIDAKAHLSLAAGKVSGTWQEHRHSASGDVTGRVVGDGLTLAIKGANFTADMRVTTDRCKQSVTIQPKGLGIHRIAVDMAKC